MELEYNVIRLPGNYYLRARYYNPSIGRFTQEDTHWNVGNMVYDSNGSVSIEAIFQSGNLYNYCGGDPVNRMDPTGEAWYHWVIGAAIVVVAGVAVVVTAGGALPAMMAVGSMASGVAAATTASTVAAGAFIGAAGAYGSAALLASMDAKSIEEFNAKGNWGTIIYTAAGAGLGGLFGYVASRGTENKNIFTNKQFTNRTKTGVSNFVSNTKGLKAAKVDFNALRPTNIRTYENGRIVGYLPDGRTVNIHPGSSVGGAPTVEIYDPITKESIKIRY